MRKSQDILLSLIRKALWNNGRMVFTSVPDWRKILLLAERQTILGLIATVIPDLDPEMKPDSVSMIRLQKKVMKIYHSHAILNRKVAETATLLDSHGIRSFLLKGQGTALNYPDPLSRQCGDIDLYVGNDNFIAALDVLEPGVTHEFRKFRHLKHFNKKDGGVEIEIHRLADNLPGRKADRMFQEWTVRSLAGTELRKGKIGGIDINLPPAAFDAVYIMNHAWHHFLIGGIGLRQICDWTMHLHRYNKEIDPDILENDLRKFGLMDAWQIFASISVRKLGLPESECPLYTGEADSKADKVMDIIWAEGNFGYHSSLRRNPRPEGFIAGKLYTFRINTQRVFRIISICPKDIILYWASFLRYGIHKVLNR